MHYVDQTNDFWKQDWKFQSIRASQYSFYIICKEIIFLKMIEGKNVALVSIESSYK